jgi:hypothetical protein
MGLTRFLKKADEFEILVQKAPHIKNYGRSRLVELTNLYSRLPPCHLKQ